MPGLKSTRGILLVAAMLAIMVLSACGGQPATGSTGPTQTAGVSGPVSFAKDVLPILQSRCANCHGGQKTEKKLNVTGYTQLMAGSENGAVLVAGDPTKSKMIQLILQGKMPKRGPKLLPDQLQTLVSWIQAGAKNN